MIDEAALRRYQNDAYFHSLVDGIVRCMDTADMSPQTVRAAMNLAFELKAQRDLRQRMLEAAR